MGKNKMTTIFLKECISDALLRIMKDKEFSKITINEISAGAGVNRSTWFRNYTSKNEALTFKLVQLWERWAKEHNISEQHRYTVENAELFFGFNFENRSTLSTIWRAGLQSVIYDAFYQVMKPQYDADTTEHYHSRFYSYGLFGLLDEWIRRDFSETPEEMTDMFYRIIENK